MVKKILHPKFTSPLGPQIFHTLRPLPEDKLNVQKYKIMEFKSKAEGAQAHLLTVLFNVCNFFQMRAVFLLHG